MIKITKKSTTTLPCKHKGFTLLVNPSRAALSRLRNCCRRFGHRSPDSFGLRPQLRPSGFTLAETLITLVIIGIVAALTVPTLINKHRKSEVETRLKSAYSIFANMFKAAEADNGSFATWDFSEFTKEVSPDATQEDAFVNKYMIPYLKVASNKKQSLEDFGYKKIIYPNGNAYNITMSRRVVTLNNGMSFWVMPGAYELSNSNFVMPEIGFYVDINGPNNGPNTIGKDIFKFIQPLINGYPLSMAGEHPYRTCSYSKSVATEEIIQRLIDFKCAYLLDPQTGDIRFTNVRQTREELLDNCKLGTHFSEQCSALIKIDGWRVADDYPWL